MRARVLLRLGRTRAVILLRHDRADNFLRNRELLEMDKCYLIPFPEDPRHYEGARVLWRLENWFAFVVVRTSSLFHANSSLVETPEILVWDAHTLPSATTLRLHGLFILVTCAR